jgi:AcrR family transcriptional regulator
MDEKDVVIRYRIMAIAAKHLVRSGFVDVSLADIGHDLALDRSIVRKHFTSMDDLLTAVIDTFLQSVEEILLPFVQGVFVPQIVSGEIAIREDRLHFASPQSAAIYSDQVIDHLEAIFDFLLVHRDEYVLFAQESLGSGAHKGCMEKLIRLFLPTAENPLLKGYEALSEIQMPPDVQADFIQSDILPILGHVMLKETLDQLSPHCVETHKKKILNAIRAHNAGHLIGQDIFFTIK